MTEKQILIWIKNNLVEHQLSAMEIVGEGELYCTDLLSAMTMRETGFLIARYVGQGMKPKDIHPMIKGDYGQRPGETEKQYHGFGYMQIDIKSYPDFVKSGDWKDPVKTYVKAMQVLEEKRKYLKKYVSELSPSELIRASIAAYNTGQGNVHKSIKKSRDVDYTTHNRDYSKEVLRYRDIYNDLPD